MFEELPTEQLIERGREAYARSDYPAALALLREAVERQPKYADIHNLVGLCQSMVGQTEAALASFQRAVEINPRYVEALVNRALTLNELGRYDEGRESFRAASEADLEEGVGRFPAVLAGRLANKHKELGELYEEGGALAEAEEQFRRGIELRPRFVDIRSCLARVLLAMGKPEEAARELEDALEVNPGFLEARINLGLAWYRLGDNAAAAREWKRCQEQRPDNPQVGSYLGMLERAAE